VVILLSATECVTERTQMGFQFSTSNNDVLSLRLISRAILTQIPRQTTDSNSDNDDTAWHLKACLRSRKHQSMVNLVCAATKKLIVMDWWSPIFFADKVTGVPGRSPCPRLPWLCRVTSSLAQSEGETIAAGDGSLFSASGLLALV